MKLSSLLRKKIASDPQLRRALHQEIARYERGVSVPLEELPEEFQEMNRNPPDSVIRVREQMEKKGSLDPGLQQRVDWSTKLVANLTKKAPSIGAKVDNVTWNFLKEKSGEVEIRFSFSTKQSILDPEDKPRRSPQVKIVVGPFKDNVVLITPVPNNPRVPREVSGFLEVPYWFPLKSDPSKRIIRNLKQFDLQTSRV